MNKKIRDYKLFKLVMSIIILIIMIQNTVYISLAACESGNEVDMYASSYSDILYNDMGSEVVVAEEENKTTDINKEEENNVEEEKYEIWVGDVQVTSTNKEDIPGLYSGSASYDPDTRTLTFCDAVITKEPVDINGEAYRSFLFVDKSLEDLTIRGNLSIPNVWDSGYGIRVVNDLIIDANITMKNCMGENGISVGNLAINDGIVKIYCDNNNSDQIAINVHGKWDTNKHSETTGRLTINGGYVYVEGTQAIKTDELIISDEMQLLKPEAGVIKNGTIYDKNGEPASIIEIKKMGESSSLYGIKFDKTESTIKVGEMIALTVIPIPSDWDKWSSFYLYWYVNGEGVELYQDQSCTKKIPLSDELVLNKTVYVKGTKKTSGFRIGVLKQLSFNEIVQAECTVNVTDGGKREWTKTSKTVLGMAGATGRIDLQDMIAEGAVIGNPIVVRGKDQLESVSITDKYRELEYKTKNNISNINISVSIPVTGAYDYDDYNITINIIGKGTEKAHEDLLVIQTDGIYGGILAVPVYEKPVVEGIETLSYNGILFKDGSIYGPTEIAPKMPGNYTVSVTYDTTNAIYSGSADFVISQKELIVSLNTVNRPYEKDNRSVSINNVTLNGVVNNDDVSADLKNVTAMMKDDKPGKDKQVVISGVELAGSASSNYFLKEQPNDVKVTIDKAEWSVTDIYTRGTAGGDGGRLELKDKIPEGASLGKLTIVKGENQLDGAPHITGATLLEWKIKRNVYDINVVLNIPVTGSEYYNDYSITVTIIGDSSGEVDTSIMINGKKVSSLKEAFSMMKDVNTEYFLDIGIDVKGEKNLTIPKTAKAVYINGYGHTVEIIGTKLTANAPLTLGNLNIKAVNKKGAQAKFTLLAKKDLNIGSNVSFDSSATTIKSSGKTVLSGILNAHTVTIKDLTIENGAILKADANSKITVKGVLKGMGGTIELGKDFNKPININGTVEGTIYFAGAKQSDGIQILKCSSKKINDATLRKCFDVKGITENTVDTYLYYYSSGKAAVFGESISYNGISYGVWKDAVAAMNADLKNAKNTGRLISFSVELIGDVNVNGNLKLPAKGYDSITIIGNGNTLAFNGDIKLTGNTVIEDISLIKINKKGNKVSGKVIKGKYTYYGPIFF